MTRRVCGVDFQGHALIPVVLVREDDGWEFVPSDPTRVTLADFWDTSEVRLFAKAVEAFLNDHLIDEVVVKKRAAKGRYAGGAASFRMGGVLQVVTHIPVRFLSPQAVSSAVERHGFAPPASLHKYQHRAFDVAMAYALASRS